MRGATREGSTKTLLGRGRICIMAVRRVLCYSSIFYLLMCLLSLHLSGKSFNSASKGIGYDLTTLIVTRDVSTPRIESIFLHPKKSLALKVIIIIGDSHLAFCPCGKSCNSIQWCLLKSRSCWTFAAGYTQQPK